MKDTKKHIVFIDDREPVKVVEEVSNYFTSQRIPVKKTRLNTGDFLYQGILIERKDCVDFIASWKDARIINQRNAMLRLAKRRKYHPYIVIQGTFEDARRQMEKVPKIQQKYTFHSWLNGILSLHEKGIGVIQLDSRRNHTNLAKVIEGLAKYKNEDKILHDVFIEPEGQSWDVKAYQCFHGIGYTTAKNLAEKMSIQDLLRRPRDNAIKELTSVQNIGSKKAEYIYNTLHKKEELTPYKELK